MQNIFIVHTPFHVFIAEIIVRNMFNESNICKNVILLELNSNYENIDPSLWANVEFLENVGGSTLGRKRFMMSEKNINLIKQYSENDTETHIFISDIAWPMNNRIFFDRHLRSRVKFDLFSDGLGTYALPSVTSSLYVRGLAKYVNGLLHCGVRYKNYLGNQFGIDRNEIEYIYAPNVNLIECSPLKKKEVSFEATDNIVNFNPEKCLFLDQPFWINVPADDWHLIRETAAKYLRLLGIKDIYYKNHHMGREEEVIYFESQGFKIINTNKCAEQIVTENNFGVVVSYLSSTLFNLKCMYDDKLHCISLFSKTISMANGYNDDTPDKIIELFNAVKVEMVEIL